MSPISSTGLQFSPDGCMADAASVLRFWFEECRPRHWFAKDVAFDALVRERFGALTRLALAGRLDGWGEESPSALALVLLLDQFTRHIWRGEARAFAGDAQAIQLSLVAEVRGWLDQEPEQARRQFWLMPRDACGGSRCAACIAAPVQALHRPAHPRDGPPPSRRDRPLWSLPPPQRRPRSHFNSRRTRISADPRFGVLIAPRLELCGYSSSLRKRPARRMASTTVAAP